MTQTGSNKPRRLRIFFRMLLAFLGIHVFALAMPVVAANAVLTYFPTGPIYEYRWKLLELALAHTQDNATPKKSPRIAVCSCFSRAPSM
jgi:hypothetical protein